MDNLVFLHNLSDPISDIEYASRRRSFYLRTVTKITILYTLVAWIAGLIVEMTRGMFTTREISDTIIATLPWVAWGAGIGFFSGLLFAELADNYVDELRKMANKSRRNSVGR